LYSQEVTMMMMMMAMMMIKIIIINVSKLNWTQTFLVYTLTAF